MTPSKPDSATRPALIAGLSLLAISIPFGLTLEALHACKVRVYLESDLRRELWTLAHAHGNLLGLLLLAWAAVGNRAVPEQATRLAISRSLRLGAILMPLGFFLGGVGASEGDPSFLIALVPIGALLLLSGLFRAALRARTVK